MPDTTLALIRAEIDALYPERILGPWTRAIKLYASDLLNKFEESHGSDAEPTTEALLNGASNWLEYSEGGCALIYDHDLRERFAGVSGLDGYTPFGLLVQQSYALDAAAAIRNAKVLAYQHNNMWPTRNQEEEENMPNNEQEHEVQCVYCGAMVPESEAADTWEGWVCDDCYEEHYTICEHCDNEVETSETIMVHNHYGILEAWCPSCVEDDAFHCEECDEFFDERYHDSHYLLGRTLCDSCYEEELEI